MGTASSKESKSLNEEEYQKYQDSIVSVRTQNGPRLTPTQERIQRVKLEDYKEHMSNYSDFDVDNTVDRFQLRKEDIIDPIFRWLVFEEVNNSLLLSETSSEIWNTYTTDRTITRTQASFYTRMTQLYDQVKDDPEIMVDNHDSFFTELSFVVQDTIIEMIDNVNTLYVTSNIWSDFAFSKEDKYSDLISKIHYIIVGPLGLEDTTEYPNVIPFTSINDVYHGYKYVKSFTLQKEITTIGPGTFSRMESLEEIIVEAEENGNGREHQHYSTVDGVLFSKDGTILIAYPPNRKVGGVVATTYTIPSTVTTIGEDAFAWTKLSRVIIPTSVTTIGRNAFQHMHALTNITVDPSQNITFNTDTSYATDGVLVSGSAFSGTYSTNAGNDVIDQPTTNNFYESMPSIVSPPGHSVRLLDASGVQIGSPYQVSLDGNMVGLNSHVSNAVTIEISAATTRLLSNGTGWQYLLNLEEITLETATGVTPHFTVVNGVLYDYAKTVALKYPPRRPVSNTHLVLEDTITSISERAFFDMRNILKITIPASVTVIKKEAFMHQRYNGHPDSDLEEVIFSSGSQLKTIQRHAFQYCRPETGTGRPGVTNFTIPKSVETIEAWAFYGMSTKISFESGSKIKKIGYQSLVTNKYGDKGLPDGLLTVGIDAMDGVTLDNGTNVLNIPASVVTLERGSMSISGVNTLNFAKRSNLSGLSSNFNNGNFAHPWSGGNLPVNIRAYGPLLEYLEWGSTNNGTWNKTSSSGQTQTSAWGLGGYLGGNGIAGQGIQRKYSYVVSFTMTTITLVAGDTPTVNIEFFEPEPDFDRYLDITIYDTNTGNIIGDVGILSAMTTTDGGKNWSGIFVPVVDMVYSGLELRLDNVYYRNNDSSLSNAYLGFSMNTTRTPLTMYVLSKSLVKDDVADVAIVFPDTSSGASFSLDRVTIYNSSIVPVLTTDDDKVWNTSYNLTHYDTLDDISISGFVPNSSIYNTTVEVIVRKVRPVITLIPEDVIIDVGDVFLEPGVSVLSGDGITDVSNDVQRTQIDTNVVGVYTVEYTYTEPSENIVIDALDPVAFTVTRQVTVGIGPVIQVQGPERMWILIEQTNTYNELGARAIDQRDGDITNNIIVSGSADTSVLGTYTITYSVTDSDNINMTATRTVQVVPPPTCFPAGTPVETDQGVVNIEKLTKYNTIRNSPVLSVTRSVGHTSVISIPKSSLYKNVPSQDTRCSLEHKIFYNGVMIKARNLLCKCKHVTRIHHNGEPLYNVLLPTHRHMVVNNMIVETLHPQSRSRRACPPPSPIKRIDSGWCVGVVAIKNQVLKVKNEFIGVCKGGKGGKRSVCGASFV